MEFNFNCCDALGCDQDGFAIIEGSYQNRIMPGFTLFVNEIIDKMGLASSQAQGLSTTITTAQKFFTSNHRMVIKATGNKVLGILKVGVKKLFLRDVLYNYHEVSPLCVLDFYVHESTQRQGIGKKLFDYMLNFEKKNPKELAYDRPSPKLIGFLKKYFGLVNYVRQNNNFVVFNEFFECLSDENNKTYDYMTNRNISRGNTPYNNYGYNRDTTKTQPSLSTVGQNLVYSNSFDNKVVDKNIYKQPLTAFQSYYFKGGDTVSYDNIYSKRKIDLINDYMQSVKKNQDQYLDEQFGMKERNIENSNGRLNQIMTNISPIIAENSKPESLFNKRNQYATVFDDKKIVENNYYNMINNMRDNSKNTISERDFVQDVRKPQSTMRGQENLQHYSPFSRYGKVYTNVLPTTSSAYGAYYNHPHDLALRNQSPNKLFY